MKRLMCLVTVLGVLAGTSAMAAPWIWDDDGDGVDDRIQQVNLLGIAAAYTGNDTLTGRLRFAATQAAGVTTFGAYVRYDHHPTAFDIAAASGTGAHVTHTYRFFDCLRVLATSAQVSSLRSLPGVTRIETIQALYPVLSVSSRAVRARDTDSDALFPSARKHLGVDGTGVMLGILDTGVNDTTDSLFPLFPGHESVRGRALGGGDFSGGDSLLDLVDINPRDRGPQPHGTHVAGIALGTGGPSRTNEGVAPGARYVDAKLLTDLGSGFGLLDAIDWILLKRDSLWLGAGQPQWRGVQVMNLSLSGLDHSDGLDLDAHAVNVAASYGILTVAAMGNGGEAGNVPSPASADSAIAVAACDDRGTVLRDDDLPAAYSNRGPRAADLDAAHFDELKPLVSAPGTAILSAQGLEATDGAQYVELSGTSMAVPHVSGLLALMEQAHPGLPAAEAQRILRFTSEHKGAPDDPFGGAGHPDPDWNSAWGYGEIDAYAAVLEAQSPGVTQVVRVRATPGPAAGQMTLRWWTQREIDCAGFHLYRSTDSLTGYTRVNPVLVAAAGVPAAPADTAHREATNRSRYTLVDTGTSLGQKYYYKVSAVDGVGGESFTPVLRAPVLTAASSPGAAAIQGLHLSVQTPTREPLRLRLSLGAGGPVRITLHDATGRSVAELLRGQLAAGTHDFTLRARTAGGGRVPCGVYWVRAVTGSGAIVRRTLLID